MRARIYAGLDERLHGAAEIQLAAHLIKLTEERRVNEHDGAFFVIED
jgi:hypothetical protein